ncbi:MAG: ATP-binding protein [Campylobacterales bacterium]
MKKLPIGIQTFSEIRTKDYLYIDKTKEAYNLIESGTKFYFLSRPRRFGKSLFLSTLQSIFEGKKELFEGLYIYDKWDWDIKYPVIKIDFFGDLRSAEGLKDRIFDVLKNNQKDLGVECRDTNKFTSCMEELIRLTYEKYNQQVVVLIDEYDKAILDNLDQMEVARENREIIKSLYTVLKGCEEYIKFAFLTGVSKFSKASIFSGLNMLRDISLNPNYGNICGYTQNDIETTILPYLDGVDLEKLKVWYNGYNFLKDDVYNPFDILQFIANDFMYKNYWFTSGTPTYLIKLIEKNNYFLPKLANLVVGDELLDSFDIDNIELEVILYQAGYLTINKAIEKRRGGFEYKLKIPNKEVQISLNDFIIDNITNQRTQKGKFQDDIYDALYDANLEDFKISLESVFSSIPYNNYTNNNIQNYEGFYASVVYVYLQSLGLDIIGEDVTNKGRIDLTIKINNIIYILEFKVGSEDALTQIKQKNYAQKYINEDKEIYLVGINFDEDEKNIAKFEWERFDRDN